VQFSDLYGSILFKNEFLITVLTYGIFLLLKANTYRHDNKDN